MATYTTRDHVLDRVGRTTIDLTETNTITGEAVTYITGLSSYSLLYVPIVAIASITGIAAGAPVTFTATTDYVLTGDAVVWTGTGTSPDNGTQFSVTYTYNSWLHAIDGFIVDTSAFIEEVTGKTYGEGGATPADVPYLVRSVATDLSVVYVLLRQSGGSSSSTSGMAYTLGKLSVDRKSDTMTIKQDSEVKIYLKRADKGLDLLLNPPGEEGAAGSAPHTLRMTKSTYDNPPDPYTGAQITANGTIRSVRTRVP